MVIIQDVLLSDDIVEKHFKCNLNACKGACCWKGDYGAPVTQEEQISISSDLEKIKPYLTNASQSLLDAEGAVKLYSDKNFSGTNLHENGACVFMVTDTFGMTQCGIEKAHGEGQSSLKKPLSCHLYPIRVSKEEPYIFESWNYDEWDICSAACQLGQEHKISIYEFCKDAIISAKGEVFYDELDAAAKHIQNEQ